MTIDGKLHNLKRRSSDVKNNISSKLHTVEREITEWSSFTKDLDRHLTDLRGAEIKLSAEIINVVNLKVLEDQLNAVKVCSKIMFT